MKALIPATLAVLLLHATIQLACGKQQAQIQSKLARVGEMLSVITQAAMHKRSLVRPSRQTIGSCSETDIVNSLRNYPADCVSRLSGINLNRIALADFDELADFDDLADFAVAFCSERCGQPFVDLFYDCNIPEEGAVLVYTCRINENGDTCGRILQATIDARTPAETACLPRSTSCSTTCQTSLQTFRDTAGCCGNLTEVGSRLGYDVAIDDFLLWESCGVPVTGLCTEGPLNSGKPLMVAKVAFIGLAILALVVLL